MIYVNHVYHVSRGGRLRSIWMDWRESSVAWWSQDHVRGNRDMDRRQSPVAAVRSEATCFSGEQ